MGATSQADYEAKANTFMTGPRDANTLERVRPSDGALLRYNPITDHFGVIGPDGFISTYMRLLGTKAENAQEFRAQGARL